MGGGRRGGALRFRGAAGFFETAGRASPIAGFAPDGRPSGGVTPMDT
jgi:hypothetical protein